MVSSIDKAQAVVADDHLNEILNDKTPISIEGWKVTYDDLPDWYNADLFKKAQDYYKRHMLGYMFSALIGLLDVLAVPSILKVLIFTKQSGVPCSAFRRYAMTVLHTHAIYMNDVTDPKSKFYSSITTLRWKHCKASKLCEMSKHEPITNRDLALTQFGFMGYCLIKPTEFGFSNDPNEHEAIVHFWRVVGYLIGIPDRLNICRKNGAETLELCRLIMKNVMSKHVQENPPNFRDMSIAMLEGISCIDISIDVDATLTFYYNLHELTYGKPLSFYSWLNLKYHKMVLSACSLPIIGYLTRSFYNNMLKLIFWIVDGYPLVAWLRFGKNNTRFVLYPDIQS